MSASYPNWQYMIECEKQNRIEAYDRYQVRKTKRLVVSIVLITGSVIGLTVLIGGVL